MRALIISSQLILAASLVPAAAEAPPPPAITVVRPYVRATPEGATTAAAYLELQAQPGISDAFVGVATPAAHRAEIHSHTMVGGVMQMRRVDSLDLAPGGKLMLAPHGNHIMLLNLKAPLKAGGHVHLTLTFKQSPPVEIDVPVIALGAAAPQASSEQPAQSYRTGASTQF